MHNSTLQDTMYISSNHYVQTFETCACLSPSRLRDFSGHLCYKNTPQTGEKIRDKEEMREGEEGKKIKLDKEGEQGKK
jgi:hypothetical protein